MWGCAVRCLYYSKIVHSCNDLNLACAQCLNRSSVLRILKLSHFSLGNTWFVLAQLSGSVAVSKAFGLGFSDEPGAGGKPTWGEHWEPWPFQTHAKPHCEEFYRREVKSMDGSDTERGIRAAGCVGKQGVQCDILTLCYFSIYIGKRLTTPSASTYWSPACKPGPTPWPVEVLLSHFSTFDLRPS